MNYYTITPSPVGNLYLSSDGISLCGLWIEGQKHFNNKLKESILCDDLPVFTDIKSWLLDYFNVSLDPQKSHGSIHDIKQKLMPHGTEFQKNVWQTLMEIPYGSVVSYGSIAKRLGIKSAQAVGQAVGRNPISIIIPCHRVVGSSGELTGYAGGLETKTSLLYNEGIELDERNRINNKFFYEENLWKNYI